jgi:hypothetical protein
MIYHSAGYNMSARGRGRHNVLARKGKYTNELIRRGDLEMGMLNMAGFKSAGAAALTLAAAVFSAVPASAQDMSEKSISVLMDYAWTLVPAQFSTPDGKVIITDKKKREDSMVPIDVAKEVIRVGRISAHAQVCELIDDQAANHKALMKREQDKKKWSDQQLLFINQLHLTTVMLLTGKVKVVDKEGSKEVIIDKDKAPATSCSDEERAKVKEVVSAYIKGGSQAAAGAAPAAPVAANAPAPEKK